MSEVCLVKLKARGYCKATVNISSEVPTVRTVIPIIRRYVQVTNYVGGCQRKTLNWRSKNMDFLLVLNIM